LLTDLISRSNKNMRRRICTIRRLRRRFWPPLGGTPLVLRSGALEGLKPIAPLTGHVTKERNLNDQSGGA